ncbi:MAG: DNA polymerase III subunit beta [Chloroflexi bacterium]|nr:DNA polymerase III subunit beta [Chloroflexota bacterium]
MRIICDRKKLEVATHNCMKAVSIRSPLPILSHLLFDVEDGRIKISATDLELGIESYVETQGSVEAKKDEKRSFTAPAKTFSDIIGQLPDGEVILEVSEGQMKITSHRSEFSLVTLPSAEFPIFPRPEGASSLTIDAGTFKEMVRLVLFSCASAEESRAVLTGVLISVNENKLTMVATDGRRLAQIERIIDQLFPGKESRVVPQHSLTEISKLLRDDDKEIEISFGEGQIFFSIPRVFLFSRVLEGEYPDYRTLIRKDYNTRAIIDRLMLLGAVRRVMITAQERINPGLIKLSFKGDGLEISSNTADLGRARETIQVAIEGEELNIAFNGKYMMEVLSNLEIEQINLDMKDPHSSGVISPVGDDSYVYILMPIRIKDEVYA